MNATTTLDSGDIPDNPHGQTIASFSYGLGLSLGVLFFIIIVTYSSYFCTRNARRPAAPTATTSTTDSVSTNELAGGGLDETTLLNFPTLLYSQAKLHQHPPSTAASGCSICLADYKETDVLRLLPECGHLFHLKCVDSWLRLNPTCPICRNSPMPTPLETPVAEGSPLRILGI